MGYSRKWLCMALLLSTIAADGARGQWTKGPQVLTPQGWMGAIAYRDGMVWAGDYNLASSTDSGKTWTQLQVFGASDVTDISFLSRDTIAVGSYFGAVSITIDGGNTWLPGQSTTGIGNAIFCVAFDHTLDTVFASNGIDFLTTTDAGGSWTAQGLPFAYSRSPFAVAKDGTVYIEAGQPTTGRNYGGSLYYSKAPWLGLSATGGTFNQDCYSIDIDSCDQGRIYIANEDTVEKGDGTSNMYYSTNAGGTWQSGFSHARPYMNGSLAIGKHALYAGTLNDGILRSTDMGVTWKNIGGPSNWPDCRYICVINDNIVLAFDEDGYIWSTFNSGGDSVRISSSDISALTVSPAKLFIADTLHCDSLTRTILFSRSGCPPSILGWSISGVDSDSFAASNLSNDSITVTLYGNKQGDQHGMFVLMLDNGTNDTVTLAGFIDTSTSVVTISTQDMSTNTLGETVSVPITINGIVRPEDVNLVLHYDGTVDYLGSFSPSGVRLDIPGDSSLGRSVLHIPGAAPGVVAGYAKFNVFNDSNEDAHATFDSVTVLTATSPCQYSMPEAVTSTITAPNGCGATMLSQLIHLGIEPHFSMRPNPTNGDVWISSTADIGEVTFAIYDMLGAERSEIVASVSKDSPVELALPEGDGVYNIVARYSGVKSMMRVVRERY